jgi:hypothetical protein
MERRIDRLEKYMITKGLNDNQVTKECGLSVGLINQAKKGKSDLGGKAVEKILSKYQDLSRVWLLTGEGPMLTSSSDTSIVNGDHSSQAVGDGATATNSEGVKECLEIIKQQQDSITNLVETVNRLTKIISKQ